MCARDSVRCGVRRWLLRLGSSRQCRTIDRPEQGGVVQDQHTLKGQARRELLTPELLSPVVA